jgi:hypothetical protein
MWRELKRCTLEALADIERHEHSTVKIRFKVPSENYLHPSSVFISRAGKSVVISLDDEEMLDNTVGKRKRNIQANIGKHRQNIGKTYAHLGAEQNPVHDSFQANSTPIPS